MKISDLYHVYAVYAVSDAILHQFRNMLIYEHISEFSLKSVNQTAYSGDTKSSKAASAALLLGQFWSGYRSFDVMVIR